MFQRIETAISPNSLGALLFATLLVVLATLLRLALEGATSLVFVTYYPAILVISLLCGFAVSVFAIALSMLAAWGLLIAPNFELSGLSGTAVFNLFFFAAISLSIAAIGDSRRTLLRRVRVDEERARLLLEELRHRTKNAYTVVQAVISQSMSDKDEAKEALNRIKSLAAMDDLLRQSHNQMVSLQAIAEQRLHAFGDRASIQGPPLDLNSSLAKVTVLILHELATNALKYGSL
jgi:K+-sensing histidine kinase KdpD